MPVAAQINEVGESVTIKISSRNQLTIPSAARKKYGFDEYALCTFTEEGILIQPIQPTDDSEDLTYKLLRYLIDKGYEGEELLAKYEELKPKFLDYATKVLEAEKNFAEGKVTTWDEARTRLKEQHDL